MSTTANKRVASVAIEDARALRDLWPLETYVRWHLAGSLRRAKPQVGDVEHVVIPVWREVSDGLFSQTRTVNLWLKHADKLLAEGRIAQHVYPNGTHRWGEKYRGISWRGFAHEVFLATPDNFGLIYLIRTGPAEYSQRVVTALKANGTPSVDGQVRAGDGAEPIPTPDEAAVLALARLPYIPPSERR